MSKEITGNDVTDAILYFLEDAKRQGFHTSHHPILTVNRIGSKITSFMGYPESFPSNRTVMSLAIEELTKLVNFSSHYSNGEFTLKAWNVDLDVTVTQERYDHAAYDLLVEVMRCDTD